MGSGHSAAGEAAAATAVLEQLLKAGMAPAEALQLLNGIYPLRDDGGFATVDLAQADLVTGKVLLYKWGGAPSYLKRRGSVELVGSSAPPPGISVQDGPPEGISLSLSRGELLVLVSDGVSGPGVEPCIRSHDGRSAKDLAAAVVAAAESDDDDRTAAVLMLQPCGGW
jgi:stage II sporulation protein E